MCDSILKIDLKVRYVGIYYRGSFYSKSRKDMKSLLSAAEIKLSVVDAFKRWETRIALSSKLGNASYSLTKYEKVNRITFPIGQEGLILVSTDPSLDPNTIIDKIIKIKENSF